jgi:hypothetical protein
VTDSPRLTGLQQKKDPAHAKWPGQSGRIRSSATLAV